MVVATLYLPCVSCGSEERDEGRRSRAGSAWRPRKPEVAAPGRYMLGPVPTTSTLYSERADHIVAPGYIELSGTSFATPIVSGIAAVILARHPDYTPDQVKGALMMGAKPDPSAAPLSVGVGEVNAGRSVELLSPPNPNLALEAFVVSDPVPGQPALDAASWANQPGLMSRGRTPPGRRRRGLPMSRLRPPGGA